MAYALGKPFVGVNHIEGHIYSVVFDNPPIEYPAFALVVSGGHTNLFLVPEPGKYRVLARTRDDAAGEAYDKVAKMLGLGYPGGPVIERLAREGDPRAVRFSLPRMGDGLPDFSFSGLKTAVSKHVRETGLQPVAPGEEPSQAVKDLAASFQSVVIRSLVGTTERLAAEHGPRTLIVAGGVACNEALRQAAREAGQRLGVPAYFPSRHLSTDNAAMIAAAGTVKLLAGQRDGLGLRQRARVGQDEQGRGRLAQGRRQLLHGPLGHDEHAVAGLGAGGVVVEDDEAAPGAGDGVADLGQQVL